jgi:thiamine kinase-like enzyme
VIPTLHGFYQVWGFLQFLALEPVGNANAGFIHGDIARRNFCRTDSGDVFLVDLERCQPSGNPSELGDEMDQVDGL